MESDKEVISRLKFIGKLQKGEKINVKYMYVQQDGFFTSISRALINQDNRRNTLNFVRNTVTKTFEIVSRYTTSQKTSEQCICCNIIKDLTTVKNGLRNLKDTYLSDIKFCCDMDTLLQEIDAKLKDLNPDSCEEKEHYEETHE